MRRIVIRTIGEEVEVNIYDSNEEPADGSTGSEKGIEGDSPLKSGVSYAVALPVGFRVPEE